MIGARCTERFSETLVASAGGFGGHFMRQMIDNVFLKKEEWTGCEAEQAAEESRNTHPRRLKPPRDDKNKGLCAGTTEKLCPTEKRRHMNLSALTRSTSLSWAGGYRRREGARSGAQHREPNLP